MMAMVVVKMIIDDGDDGGDVVLRMIVDDSWRELMVKRLWW